MSRIVSLAKKGVKIQILRKFCATGSVILDGATLSNDKPEGQTNLSQKEVQPIPTRDEKVEISQEILSSLLNASLQQNDHKTVDIIITEVGKIKKLTNATIEKTINHYISQKDYIRATGLMSSAISNRVKISESICKTAIKSLTNYLRWDEAAIFLRYMILANYEIDSTLVFFVIGGLMRNEETVAKAVDIVTAIYESKREDLGEHINFSKIDKFGKAQNARALPRQTSSSSSSSSSLRESLALADLSVDTSDALLSALHRAMLASIPSFHEGRVSFTLTKTLVSLACVSRNYALAASYIRETVAIATANPHVDLLAILRGYSQAVGITNASTIAPLLLEIAVQHMDKLQLENGPLTCIQFMKMYWVLSSTVATDTLHTQISDRNTVTHTTNASTTSNTRERLSNRGMFPMIGGLWEGPGVEQEADLWAFETSFGVVGMVDPQLSVAYTRLVKFLQDRFLAETTLSVGTNTGYLRRQVRVLCDELGLYHKIETRNEALFATTDVYEDTPYLVKIWKGEGNSINKSPLSLPEVIRKDLCRGHKRKLELYPPYWDRVREQLLSLDLAILEPMSINVTSSMRFYGSASWGLCLMDLLQEKFQTQNADLSDSESNGQEYLIPTPLIMNVVSLCYKKQSGCDMYTLLETLRLATASTSSSTYPSVRMTDSGFSSSAGAGGRTMKGGFRDPRDWNRVCLVAWNSGFTDMHPIAFRDSFLEVMRIMQSQGVELELSTMRTLLRFLIQTQPKADMTWRILRKLYQDKALSLGYMECTAVSQLMLKQLPVMPAHSLQLAKPWYSSPNYLLVTPLAVNQIAKSVHNSAMVLGKPFVEAFDQIWPVVHLSEDRRELFERTLKLLSVTSSGGLRTQLIENNSMEIVEAREALGSLALYLGYLVALYDTDYRQAFDLLYVTSLMLKETDDKHDMDEK